jgi:hypothetical protein
MAADDDDEMVSDNADDAPEDLDAEGPDEDEIAESEDADVEPDADELEDDLFVGEEAEDEDTDEVADEDEDEDEDAEEAGTTRTKRRTGDEEEDEDDELLSPDDVEADLDRILKDRLVTAEDDEDEEDEEPEDRAEGGDRLQPKRADEQLCPNCFLLVRATAPGCPVGDDDCPIFG